MNQRPWKAYYHTTGILFRHYYFRITQSPENGQRITLLTSWQLFFVSKNQSFVFPKPCQERCNKLGTYTPYYWSVLAFTLAIRWQWNHLLFTNTYHLAIKHIIFYFTESSAKLLIALKILLGIIEFYCFSLSLSCSLCRILMSICYFKMLADSFL